MRRVIHQTKKRRPIHTITGRTRKRNKRKKSIQIREETREKDKGTGESPNITQIHKSKKQKAREQMLEFKIQGKQPRHMKNRDYVPENRQEIRHVTRTITLNIGSIHRK